MGWIEDNRELLRGKQLTWHKLVKEEVFIDNTDEHIVVKKITEKVNNMKKRWKEAKAMQERSGYVQTIPNLSTRYSSGSVHYSGA